MSSLEFQGKNVDKAVKKACEALNIAPDEIKYEVITRGSSGIFGLAGAKKARIRVSVPEKTPEVDADTDSKTDDAAVFEEKIQAETSISESTGADDLQGHGIGENPRKLARDVLERIIGAITSDATISTEETNGRIHLNVAGGNAGILIGKKGQTLEAIQSLVDKIVNKHNDHHDKIRVQIDVEGYLATRQLNLEKLAVRLADKSKRIRKPISLGQMNGYDRRIVHLALKSDPEVQTKSRGEGYMRKLVIFPKKNSTRRQPSH
jgi:spoIIIJ-associated protein